MLHKNSVKGKGSNKSTLEEVEWTKSGSSVLSRKESYPLVILNDMMESTEQKYTHGSREKRKREGSPRK